MSYLPCSPFRGLGQGVLHPIDQAGPGRVAVHTPEYTAYSTKIIWCSVLIRTCPGRGATSMQWWSLLPLDFTAAMALSQGEAKGGRRVQFKGAGGGEWGGAYAWAVCGQSRL